MREKEREKGGKGGGRRIGVGRIGGGGGGEKVYLHR